MAGAKPVILAYGTSLTAAWPQYVDRAIKAVGIPAGDSRAGVERFEHLVAEVRPAILFLEFSINDCRWCTGITPGSAASLTGYMIQRAREWDATVFLMTMHGYCVGRPDLLADANRYALRIRHPIEPYHDAYRSLAASMRAGLIDIKRHWDALPEAEVARLIPDGARPTEEGWRTVVAPAVRAVLDGMIDRAA